MQSLPLEVKIRKSKQRISEWIEEFGEDGVYVSFSGGKDSTVLMDLVRSDYPNVEAVFVNTGLEYPSVRKFAESKDNVTVIRPKMNFREVIINYGYPVISKEVSLFIHEMQMPQTEKNYNTRNLRLKGIRSDGTKANNGKIPDKYMFLIKAPFKISNQCCNMMKKKPAKLFEKENGKKPFIGTMADESRVRERQWLKNGCNAFNIKNPASCPISFWTENDVLTYIHEKNIPIAEAYGEVVVKGSECGQISIANMLSDYRECQFCTTGRSRTGCVFCMFGIVQDLKRFVQLKEMEPKLYSYVMRGGEWNEQGMWQPNENGLGYKFVIDWLNENGNLQIEY